MSICYQISTSPLKSSKQEVADMPVVETVTAANASLYSPVVVTATIATIHHEGNRHDDGKGEEEARESPQTVVAVNLFCDESMPPNLSSALPLPIPSATTAAILSNPTNNAGNFYRGGNNTMIKKANRYGRHRRRHGRFVVPTKASFAAESTLVRYNSNSNNDNNDNNDDSNKNNKNKNNNNNNDNKEPPQPLPLQTSKVTFSTESNTVLDIPDRESYKPGEKYRRWYSVAEMRSFRESFRNDRVSQFLQQQQQQQQQQQGAKSLKAV